MENEGRKEFGHWLRSMRKETGLSLMEVSKDLGYESRGTISSVESGFTSLPIEQIHPISEVYEIDANRVLDKLFEHEHDLWTKYMKLAGDIINDYHSRQFAEKKAEEEYIQEYLKKRPFYRAQNRRQRRKTAALARRAHHHLIFPSLNSAEFGSNIGMSDNGTGVNPFRNYILCQLMELTATPPHNKPHRNEFNPLFSPKNNGLHPFFPESPDFRQNVRLERNTGNGHRLN